MKINSKELQQIIKEEALRIKTRMKLESERNEILKKLNSLNEGDEQIDEIFGFSKKEQFESNKQLFIKAWTAKGVPQPTPEEMTAIEAQAQADKYQGKMGLNGTAGQLTTAKFVYRPASKINWNNQMGGGGTGGNPTGGSAGA